MLFWPQRPRSRICWAGWLLVWLPAPVICCPMSPSTSAKFALSTRALPFWHPSQPLLGTLGSSGNCWMLTVLQGVGKCLSHPRRPARSKLRILSTLKSFCIPAGNFSSSQLTEESGHRVQSFLRRLSISVSYFSCAPMDCSPSGSSVHGDSSRKNAGLTFPSPGDIPDPGIEPGTPALQADSLPSEPPGKPLRHLSISKF